MKKYLFLLFLLSGCSILDESKTERRTVTIACNKGSIQSYLNDGWTVENTNTRKVECISKFYGQPGEIGTEVEYIISRKSKEKRQWVKGISSIPEKIVDGWFSVDVFIDKNITNRKNKDKRFRPQGVSDYQRIHIYYNKRNAQKDAKKYNCYLPDGSLDIHKYRRYNDPKERRGWQICRTRIWPKYYQKKN